LSILIVPDVIPRGIAVPAGGDTAVAIVAVWLTPPIVTVADVDEL
jgi:hypothetical protein